VIRKYLLPDAAKKIPFEMRLADFNYRILVVPGKIEGVWACKPAQTPSSYHKLCKFTLSTVEKGHTLSAERKVRAKSGDFAAYRLSIC
jgi:hypothetical protein